MERNYVIATLCIVSLLWTATCFTLVVSVNTPGEVTSHNLWSRHDRHVVGISRCNVWS